MQPPARSQTADAQYFFPQLFLEIGVLLAIVSLPLCCRMIICSVITKYDIQYFVEREVRSTMGHWWEN